MDGLLADCPLLEARRGFVPPRLEHNSRVTARDRSPDQPIGTLRLIFPAFPPGIFVSLACRERKNYAFRLRSGDSDKHFETGSEGQSL